MSRLRFLLPYLRKYRGRVLAGMAAIFASAMIGLLNPLLVGQAIDALPVELAARAPLDGSGPGLTEAAIDAIRSSLIFFGLLVVGVAVFKGLFTYLQRMILVTVSRDVEFDLRDRYFATLERQSLRFFQDRYTGDLMARATNDLTAVRMLCGPAIMYATNTVFTAIGALAFMIHIHPPLTLIALATMPFVAIVTKVFGSKIHVLFERVQENFSDLSTQAQESFAGVRVVRAYVQESAEEERFERLNRRHVERNRSLIRWNAAFHPVLEALIGLGFVTVLFFGGRFVLNGAISVGEFVSFQLFLSLLIWPMIAIGWVINLFQRGTASLRRMEEIFETVPEIADSEHARDLEQIVGALRIDDLSFRYSDDSPIVLDSISIDIAAGQTVAIVGRTGSGKSTLLAMVPRLFDPPPGKVFVDGVDVLDLKLETLRRAIGMVPQESFLFSTTLRDNIAFGRPEATDSEVLEAARLAGLGDDLGSFPRGLETLVGERGITLSGGQKQRVALARAILRQPSILMLDDSLSAVDTQTEEAILSNLESVFEDRTVLLVSHRVSTVKGADLILVLDDGRIAERGTHEELIGLGGLYADLESRQRLEDELAAQAV